MHLYQGDTFRRTFSWYMNWSEAMEKNRRKSYAIKIDLKGAYDNVNWNGLVLMLKRIGFLVKIMD